MGQDTKGFILSKNKDIFKICSIVEKALVSEIMKDAEIEHWQELWNKGEKYTYPRFGLNPIGMVTAIFKFAGEDRQLSIFTTCDSDYSYFKKGKKVILSLGAWGSSVRLMECVLKALSAELGGKIYIDENDCDSDDWREVK